MMHRWGRTGRLLALTPVLALQACYTHAVVQPDQIALGSSVQARISAAEAERLAPAMGVESRVLRGEVIDVHADGVMLEVGRRASTGQWLAQRVTIPRSDILEMEIRELDRVRTFGLITGVAVLGGIAAYSQFEGSSSGTGGPPRPGGENVRIPIGFRVSF